MKSDLQDSLTLIGEGFNDCFTIVDMIRPGRLCIYINSVFTQNTGYSCEDVIGKNLSILQGPKTSEDSILFMRQSFDQNLACCQDVVNYRKDGSPFINRLVMLPIQRDSEHYFLGFQNIIADGDHYENTIDADTDISSGEINHVLNSPLASLFLNVEYRLTKGETRESILKECSDAFVQINDYCRNIDRPMDFKGYNPFRN